MPVVDLIIWFLFRLLLGVSSCFTRRTRAQLLSLASLLLYDELFIGVPPLENSLLKFVFLYFLLLQPADLWLAL